MKSGGPNLATWRGWWRGLDGYGPGNWPCWLIGCRQHFPPRTLDRVAAPCPVPVICKARAGCWVHLNWTYVARSSLCMVFIWLTRSGVFSRNDHETRAINPFHMLSHHTCVSVHLICPSPLCVRACVHSVISSSVCNLLNVLGVF